MFDIHKQEAVFFIDKHVESSIVGVKNKHIGSKLALPCI